MQSNQIGIFVESRPFVRFVMHLVDGRTFHVNHPEFVMLAQFNTGIWFLHESGQAELIDIALISSMCTAVAIDISQFLPE